MPILASRYRGVHKEHKRNIEEAVEEVGEEMVGGRNGEGVGKQGNLQFRIECALAAATSLAVDSQQADAYAQDEPGNERTLDCGYAC